MLTLPQRGCMTAGKAGRRRARRSKWSIELATEKGRHPGEECKFLCELLKVWFVLLANLFRGNLLDIYSLYIVLIGIGGIGAGTVPRRVDSDYIE